MTSKTQVSAKKTVETVEIKEQGVQVLEQTAPRAPLSDDSIEKIAGYISGIMNLLRLPVTDPSLSGTPLRVAKVLATFNTPFDPAALLKAGFQTDADASSMVTQSEIPFAMLCEHHFLPAVGKAYIAYLPSKGRVVGLSKLARLVEAVGRERPTLQETATARIADILSEVLDARGVFVVIKAEHTCMTIRGAQVPGTITTTSVVKGTFRDSPQAKMEAMSLLGL